MSLKEDVDYVEFCVNTNNTENCYLKIDYEDKRNLIAEAVIAFIILSFFSWNTGKVFFVEFNLKCNHLLRY